MFEKIIDLFVQAWDVLAPAEVLDAYHGGVVLRWGKYHRTLGPGFNWKWPVVERVIVANTCVTTQRLPPQTLTTKDDVPVVVACIVKYQIKDVRPFLIDIWDQTDVLADVAMGAVRSAVNKSTWEELVKEGAEVAVLKAVRDEVNQYGFKIHKITFTDLGKVRSLRILQQGVMENIAN